MVWSDRRRVFPVKTADFSLAAGPKLVVEPKRQKKKPKKSKTRLRDIEVKSRFLIKSERPAFANAILFLKRELPFHASHIFQESLNP